MMSDRIGAHIGVLVTLAFGEAGDSTIGYWSHPLPLHPKAVHIPMALCVLMPLIAAGIWLAVRRGLLAPRTWVLVAALQAATLGSGFFALVSGQDDGGKVEGYASDAALSTHENRAHIFLYAAGVNLLVCSTACLLSRRPDRQQLVGVIAVAGLISGAYAGYRVGDAGGRLVYVANASDAHR